MKIKCFGHIQSTLETEELDIPNQKNVLALKQFLAEQYPSLGNLKFAISVDKVIQSENVTLNPDAEIALLPPFSGG